MGSATAGMVAGSARGFDFCPPPFSTLDSGGAPAGTPSAPIETDPAIVDELIGRNQASIAAMKRDIRTKSGPALFDFILADVQELIRAARLPIAAALRET